MWAIVISVSFVMANGIPSVREYRVGPEYPSRYQCMTAIPFEVSQFQLLGVVPPTAALRPQCVPEIEHEEY